MPPNRYSLAYSDTYSTKFGTDLSAVRLVAVSTWGSLAGGPVLYLLALFLLAAPSAASAGDGQAEAVKQKRVKIFLLVGQSNMEGKGNPEHLVTYKDDPLIAPTFNRLRDEEGWKTRDEVWITYPTYPRGPKHGRLTVGFGTKGEHSIGPEFGFGHEMGEAYDDPVLLIKIAWGGKSLAVDFRPPSAPPTDDEIRALWEKQKRRNPEVTKEAARGQFGHYYREMIRLARAELAAIDQRFPELQGCEPELAGFVWHQGFNDKIRRELRDQEYAPYSLWLQAFIKDVRSDLSAPRLPVVIGELSTGGMSARGDFQTAQRDAAEKTVAASFVTTAEFYDTSAHELFEKGYWKGTPEQRQQWQAVGNDRPYHYLGSGKTYYLKGVAFAEALLSMQVDDLR